MQERNKGKIDHSTAGAQWLWKRIASFKFKEDSGIAELCGQILFLCIASHHSGLIDCLSLDGENKFDGDEGRTKKADDKTYLDECIKNADKIILEKAQELISSKDFIREMHEQLRRILGKKDAFSLENLSNKDRLNLIKDFNLGFFTRFLFSCLIDADRINSAEFEFPERIKLRNNILPNWDLAIKRLDEKLASFKVRNEIDKIRKDVSDNCAKRAEGAQGIYTLLVPTGGGKTLASLRFALNHAKKYNLERIIYIIPYTSIIDQNAKEVREILDRTNEPSWVLEHHSNIEPEKQTWEGKLAAENWNSRIVFTTMVQFLDVLFGSGTRGVRRLHQLANSVVVFDEIQTLPIKCVHLFCNAVNFLTEYTKITAVLCTATQPLLNALKNPHYGQLNIPLENELVGKVDDVKILFNQLERVEIHNKCKINGWTCDEIGNFIIKQYEQLGNCLVIVNTKEWAQKLYQFCKNLNISKDIVYHLSTNQCPAHRKIIIDTVKKRLEDKLPVICISTQLIEAGVDISFACVIRFLAGLDSIAQAAGRCNRHGELADIEGKPIKGQVYILNPDKENIDLLPEIQLGKESSERILGEKDITPSDWLNPTGIKRYFTYYLHERASEMAYPLKNGDNILNLLSDNYLNNGVNRNQVRKKYPMLMQSFMAAAEQFKAIDAPTKGIIVKYGERENIVTGLCSVYAKDREKYAKLLQEAQRYSVNVFPNVWDKLIKANAVKEIQGEGIYYLDEQYYSEEFGLSIEVVSKLSSHII